VKFSSTLPSFSLRQELARRAATAQRVCPRIPETSYGATPGCADTQGRPSFDIRRLEMYTEKVSVRQRLHCWLLGHTLA